MYSQRFVSTISVAVASVLLFASEYRAYGLANIGRGNDYLAMVIFDTNGEVEHAVLRKYGLTKRADANSYVAAIVDPDGRLVDVWIDNAPNPPIEGGDQPAFEVIGINGERLQSGINLITSNLYETGVNGVYRFGVIVVEDLLKIKEQSCRADLDTFLRSLVIKPLGRMNMGGSESEGMQGESAGPRP